MRDLYGDKIDAFVDENRLGSIALEEGEKLGLVTIF